MSQYTYDDDSLFQIEMEAPPLLIPDNDYYTDLFDNEHEHEHEHENDNSLVYDSPSSPQMLAHAAQSITRLSLSESVLKDSSKDNYKLWLSTLS